MDAQAALGFKETMGFIVGDIAKALSVRVDETQQQRALRARASAAMIMAFFPRDPIEAILCGHCVSLHELIVVSTRDLLRGEVDEMRRSSRNSIVALDKAFGNNLKRLESYQTRISQGKPDAAMPGGPIGDAVASALEVAAEVSTRTATPPAHVSAEAQAAEIENSLDGVEIVLNATPEAIEACRANPEAMAALDAGDPEGFAHALGVESPKDAFYAAAVANAIFKRRHDLGLTGANEPPASTEIKLAEGLVFTVVHSDEK